MDTLNRITSIAEVAFGLGFVIFLHELGHFLLAKWNGVKVEKFSIGFGPTLLGFKRGETEYALAAVPLGGFVKMLGESPEEDANKSTDPRAFPNKSVGARMAIISAGVVMNLILGLACFVYAYGQGRDELSPRIGAVLAGSPAYQAGMKAGDEIVSLDGRHDLGFETVTLKIRLSGEGQVIHFELKRPGAEALIPVDIEPRREGSADVPGIGITWSESLTLARPPFLAPAGMVDVPKAPFAGLKAGDRVVAAGPPGATPSPVSDARALDAIFVKYRDRPVELTVERKASLSKGKDADARPERITVALPPVRFVDFGVRLQMRPIVAVPKGSIAEKAGFRAGDLIVKVDGQTDFDPLRLPTLIEEHAGRELTIEVRRKGAALDAPTEALTVTPDATPAWTERTFPNEPLEVPGLGLAYQVRTRVEAVRPGSPAAKAGIKPGDLIDSMTLPPIAGEKAAATPVTLKFDEKTPGWAHAFQFLQYRPRQQVTLTLNGSADPVKITPEPVDGWFDPYRGLEFQALIHRLPPLGASAALRRGWDDTLDNIQSIYAMLRSLVQRRVSPKNLGGPILIAQVAYDRASESLTDLVHFLGILSINLAVLNFLPIPPLDGGQMVFLLAEKVRGRPLPDSALVAGTYVGLLLVLCLMVYVLFQDVARYF